MLDTETGATEEHKLMHTSGEAEGFYRKLASPAIVGIETVGNDQWFVQLLQKLGHELCVGDAAQIRASYPPQLARTIQTTHWPTARASCYMPLLQSGYLL